MKFISSRDNPLFKRLVRLSQGRAEKVQTPQGRAYRMVLEGEHLCRAWLDHQSQPELMIVSESRAGQPPIIQLAGRIEAERIVCFPDALFKSISNVENSQGVIFLAVAPQPVRPQRIIETSLWLDRIQDPGNVGTLLRTAAAAGIRHVYLAAGSAAAWSPKVLRSAQGAHFVLAVHEHIDLVAECEYLEIPLLATSLDNAVSLYDTQLPEQAVWVVGHEGQGVDPILQKKAQQRIFIPQVPQVESLNVGVAAGICLFEHRRQFMRQKPLQ